MGAAAVPAATTAFGGSMAAATATAPALMSAAAVAAPMASAGASMMMNPLILNAGASGGLLSGIGTAMQVADKYSGLISSGLAGVQAIGSYQRGQFMQESYKIQTEQMRAQQEINRLNLLKAANDKTRELMGINASVVATGFASGVSGFDGSVKLVAQKNEERYLRDISTLEFNETSSKLFEDAQSSMLLAASDEAVRGSKFEALYHIGNAYNIYNKTKV